MIKSHNKISNFHVGWKLLFGVGRPFICDVLQCKVTKASSVAAEWAGGASARYTSVLPSQDRMNGWERWEREAEHLQDSAYCTHFPPSPNATELQRLPSTSHGVAKQALHYLWCCVANSQPSPLQPHRSGRTQQQKKHGHECTPHAFVAQVKKFTTCKMRDVIQTFPLSPSGKLEDSTHLFSVRVAGLAAVLLLSSIETILQASVSTAGLGFWFGLPSEGSLFRIE